MGLQARSAPSTPEHAFSDIPPLAAGYPRRPRGVVALADSTYVLSIAWTGRAPTPIPGSRVSERYHPLDGQDTPDPQNTIESEAFAFVATDGNEFAISNQTGGGVVLTALGEHPAHTMPTSLSDVRGSGFPGGSATLSATLMAGGAEVAGKNVVFTLNDDGTVKVVGTATTGLFGVATLSDVSLAGFTGGTYVGAVGATFSGDSTYLSSTSTGTLFVDVVQGTRPPFIVSSKTLFTRKVNKRGKPVGDQILSGFVFDFSSALDPSTATDIGNYQVDALTTKRVRKKVERILSPITNFKVSYTAATDSVTLTLASKQTFPTGGQITVVGGPSGGITSSSGAARSGSTAFTISKSGKQIVPSAI